MASLSMPMDDDEATAPPYHEFEPPPGYETLGFKEACHQPPPPSYEDSIAPGFRAAPSISQLSEEQVRDALAEFVTENCCYSAKVAKEIKILDILMRSVFHYTLVTFTESRQTRWSFEPYTGQQLLDGPRDPPAAWSIPVSPNAPFVKGSKQTEIPHTSSVRNCHACAGIGRNRCSNCCGRGGERCVLCVGSGRSENGRRCSLCGSTGRQRCTRCVGHGQVRCSTCLGLGNLRVFLLLTVSWLNHVSDEVSDELDRSDLPESLIRDVSGEVAFEERSTRLYPLNNFPDRKINAASERLIQDHSRRFVGERILEQKHEVQLVPVANVEYDWRNGRKRGFFTVAGREREVYFPDYPKSNCGCMF